jgi:hypothetical protein
MRASEPDTREQLDVPRVVVLESRADGIFLNRYDETGDEVGDTWHQSFEEAKEQAAAEYADNLGPWTEVPQSEDDAVAFALRLADV